MLTGSWPLGPDAADDALTRMCDRIEAVDGEIQAFISEPDRRGRVGAEIAAALPGPLTGIPVGIKDIIQVDGLPTRAGSALPPEVLAGPQASLVDRLRAAGAVVAGKTVTAEFAVAAPGPTRNPHNPRHTPGGSSSGSAAAVAAGMVPLAVGTQTVGSVIRPAAFCGIVGFRPTYGRIPTDGVIANAPSLDTVGVFAVDVAGVAAATGVLCDGWRPASDGRPTLGVPVGPYLENADNFVQLDRLRDRGFTVRDIDVMADFAEIAATLHLINRYEVAQVHAEWFAEFGDLYRTETTSAIRQGQTIGRADYEQALVEKARFTERIQAAMECDIWVAPAATGPAPETLASTGNPIMCLPWSYAGLPAVTLPAGKAENGLPLGLQCIGRAGSDEQLLEWARDIEKALA